MIQNVLLSYSQVSNADTDIENRLMDPGRGRWGRSERDEWRQRHGNVHTTTCKT